MFENTESNSGAVTVAGGCGVMAPPGAAAGVPSVGAGASGAGAGVPENENPEEGRAPAGADGAPDGAGAGVDPNEKPPTGAGAGADGAGVDPPKENGAAAGAAGVLLLLAEKLKDMMVVVRVCFWV